MPGTITEDVYDLRGLPGAYPAAIPVLVRHLHRGYDDPTLGPAARHMLRQRELRESAEQRGRGVC